MLATVKQRSAALAHSSARPAPAVLWPHAERGPWTVTVTWSLLPTTRPAAVITLRERADDGTVALIREQVPEHVEHRAVPVGIAVEPMRDAAGRPAAVELDAIALRNVKHREVVARSRRALARDVQLGLARRATAEPDTWHSHLDARRAGRPDDAALPADWRDLLALSHALDPAEDDAERAPRPGQPAALSRGGAYYRRVAALYLRELNGPDASRASSAVHRILRAAEPDLTAAAVRQHVREARRRGLLPRAGERSTTQKAPDGGRGADALRRAREHAERLSRPTTVQPRGAR